MDYIKKKNSFISEFVNELDSSNLSVFFGAGMSFEAGLPSWKNLLKDIAQRININIEDVQDYYQTAQYCENKLGSAVVRNSITHLLNPVRYESFILKSILELPANNFWTTNFDRVLEKNIELVFGSHPDIIYRDTDLIKTRERSAKIIFKMNGHIDDLNSLILTKKDLEGYEYDHHALLTFLRRELIVNTFLFLGYSFTDTLILSALRDIRRCLGAFSPTHFHYTIFKEREDQEFSHFINNLEQSYGIKALVIPKNLFPNNLSRSELNTRMDEERINIIDTINKQIRMKQIYVSGSFREISHQEEAFATDLSKHLTSMLFEHGYRLCNSAGKGVGSRIIGYASEWLIEHNQQISRKLILKSRSFHNYKETNLETKTYRMHVMRDSGVAIFMFGQGKSTSNSSNGVRQEFEVAKDLGMKIIPLGVTGYESSIIWEEVKNSITCYGYLENYIDKLKSENDPEKLAKIIIAIINDVQ